MLGNLCYEYVWTTVYAFLSWRTFELLTIWVITRKGNILIHNIVRSCFHSSWINTSEWSGWAVWSVYA